MPRSSKFQGWHFVDWPVRDGQTNPLPYDTSLEGNGSNVLYGVRESVQSMTTGLPETRGLYLACVLHLVGDAHQPLHCCERDGDKGGNDFEVERGTIRSLHALWDDALTTEYRMRSAKAHSDEKIERAASELEASVPLASVAAEARDLDPRHWALESYAIAVKYANQGIGPGERPTDAYEARLRSVCDKRCALAGYRLANLLNSLAPKG